MLVTELSVTVAMLALTGRDAFDRRILLMIAKCAVACVIAVAIERSLAFLGPVRLVPAAAGYLAFVVVSRALPLREMVAMVRGAYRRPSQAGPEAE
jgi:hypothetical protein